MHQVGHLESPADGSLTVCLLDCLINLSSSCVHAAAAAPISGDCALTFSSCIRSLCNVMFAMNQISGVEAEASRMP